MSKTPPICERLNNATITEEDGGYLHKSNLGKEAADVIESLLDALAFYANEDRYDLDEDGCPMPGNPARNNPEESLDADSGERARAAIQQAWSK